MTVTSSRQLLATVMIATLVLTAGCSSIGVGVANPGPPLAVGGPSNPPAEPGDVSSGTAGPTAVNVTDVAGNQTSAMRRLGSLTIRTESRTADWQGAIVQTRTLRINYDTGQASVNNTRVVEGTTIGPGGVPEATESRVRTAYYADGNVVFVRATQSGNATTYDRRRRSDLVAGTATHNGSSLRSLDKQFNLKYEQLRNGDHQFYVNSASQITGDPVWEDDLEHIALRIRVDDETGLVTYLRYRLVLDDPDNDQSLTYKTVRVISGVDNTTVTPPAWLPAAKNQTEPLLVQPEPYLPSVNLSANTSDVTDLRVCGRNATAIADTYNSNVDAVPGFIRGAVTNETIHGVVNDDENPNYMVVTGSDRRISEFRRGIPESSTIRVETNCETLTTILDAENAVDAFVTVYNGGEVDVRGTDPLSKIVVGAIKLGVKIAQWIGLI